MLIHDIKAVIVLTIIGLKAVKLRLPSSFCGCSLPVAMKKTLGESNLKRRGLILTCCLRVHHNREYLSVNFGDRRLGQLSHCIHSQEAEEGLHSAQLTSYFLLCIRIRTLAHKAIAVHPQSMSSPH